MATLQSSISQKRIAGLKKQKLNKEDYGVDEYSTTSCFRKRVNTVEKQYKDTSSWSCWV